ncbi:histidine phosphatase family protein, partial [Pelagibacteraceae bacterium]|nr:histidine phosphatase family protein [Pelagibacteraceae bacterium]
MKKYQIIFLFILLFLNHATATETLIDSLKKGKKIVFIRHALAPGNGDPQNFDIKDCLTQRNLNQIGINQSKKIGLIFKKNKIEIGKVLSSEWCRCKDTAKLAFKNYETFDALNSFYD